MIKYNFDEIIDRSNTDAVKVERCKVLFGTEKVIPLWVADMDFKTPDFILNAINKRMEHPILGYTIPPRNFFDLFILWVKEHHNWEPEKRSVGFVPGIVPAIALAVQCYTNPEDEIIIQPPVYHPFIHIVKNNGRRLVYNELKVVNGKFEMDFEDLESKITPKTKMLILCNPHNPGGKVWSLSTLKKLDKICSKHNILVISDEIHADMVFGSNKHIPFASVSEKAAQSSITFMSPSKVFNMPGLISSFYVIPNPELHKKYSDYLIASEANSGNIFAYQATIACYARGENWRVQMLKYVQKNIDYVIDFLNEFVPQIKPMRPDASFLIWLDCKGLGMETDELYRFFALEAGLGFNKGTMFGPGGEYHFRMNVAVPRKTIEKAMIQLQRAISQHKWK
ncbi:pyridoxal phosphate-dependent aminotransferase [Paludibacter sp.]